MTSHSPPPEPDVLTEDGVRKAICGYTWPGIEYGQPPSCPYTFFEYVDTVRFGDLGRFKMIEVATAGWWFPTLDRGAGALLHFAVDHGQLEAVKYLIEQRKVPINQQSINNGWTPLHRCAYVAHYRHAPYIDIFEFLLKNGADPTLTARDRTADDSEKRKSSDILQLVVEKGEGWKQGEVRAKLAALIEEYKQVPKTPTFVYDGKPFGEKAARVLAVWSSLPKLYPPKNWRPPPPPGHVGAASWRRHAEDPWKPAGQDDGSCFLRPMTPEELEAQAQQC